MTRSTPVALLGMICGGLVGVMHACGHDINMTCLVGTTRMPVQLRSDRSGTLLLVGQPAEEIGAGTRAMLADGLLTRFPKPDMALALHCDGRYPHGHVNYREGQMQAHVAGLTELAPASTLGTLRDRDRYPSQINERNASSQSLDFPSSGGA